jgi:hypothetical protein
MNLSKRPLTSVLSSSLTSLLAATILLHTASASASPEEERAKLPKFERENFIYQVEAGKWKGPRLSDGQPDVQGQWSNTIGNHNNLVDPQGGQGNGGGRRSDKPKAPSRVTDPTDGQVPFQPWARELQKEYAKHLLNPVKPEYHSRVAPRQAHQNLLCGMGLKFANIQDMYCFCSIPVHVLFISMTNRTCRKISSCGMVTHAAIGREIH